MFYLIVILQTIGMFTSSCQKVLVYRTKDNVTLSYGQILLELSIFAIGLLFIFAYNAKSDNTLLSDVCGPLIDMSANDKNMVDAAWSHLNT
jgi:hypothetical protein